MHEQRFQLVFILRVAEQYIILLSLDH